MKMRSYALIKAQLIDELKLNVLISSIGVVYRYFLAIKDADRNRYDGRANHSNLTQDFRNVNFSSRKRRNGRAWEKRAEKRKSVDTQISGKACGKAWRKAWTPKSRNPLTLNSHSPPNAYPPDGTSLCMGKAVGVRAFSWVSGLFRKRATLSAHRVCWLLRLRRRRRSSQSRRRFETIGTR